MTLTEALEAYTTAVVNRSDTALISQAIADLEAAIHASFTTQTQTVTTTVVTPTQP